jgi:hypothetical protein
LNPIVKFYDPSGLSENNLWSFNDEQSIGFLRHAEIKHGRVAMAAFVGYCVQSNWHFPWPMTTDGTPFPSTDLSPPEQWASLPEAAKLQIVLFIGFLEIYSEASASFTGPAGLPHYVNGGIPGKYPTFDSVPHPVPLNLFDPLGLSKKRTPEQKAKGLKAEINNGRLAQLGIFGFLCEQTIPGSVPVLSGVVKPYAGDLIGGLDFTF